MKFEKKRWNYNINVQIQNTLNTHITEKRQEIYKCIYTVATASDIDVKVHLIKLKKNISKKILQQYWRHVCFFVTSHWHNFDQIDYIKHVIGGKRPLDPMSG